MISERRAPYRLARLARSAGVILLPLAGYLALAVLVFGSTWRAPFTTAIGDGGDAPQFMWFLRWPAFALAHHQNPLLTGYLDYPVGVNLMWNDSIPLPAALLSPISLTLGPWFTFNLLITLSVALSAWTAFLAVRRYVRHAASAVVGGLLYGFSPFMMAHAWDGIPHVMVAFLPPLMLIVLDDLLVRHRHSPLLMGVALGVLAAAQLASAEELLATAALVGVLGLFLVAALNGGVGSPAARLTARRALRPLAVAAGTFLLLGAFPLATQFLGPQRMGGVLLPRNEYVNDLLNFVLPTAVQHLAPDWAIRMSSAYHGVLAEWNGYLGIPLLSLLILAAIVSWSHPAVRFFALLGLLVAVLSLGATLHVGGHSTLIPSGVLGLPFILARGRLSAARFMAFAPLIASLAIVGLPLLDNLLPARLMVLAYLSAGVVLACWVDRVIAASPRRRLLGGLAVAAALVFLVPRLPFVTTALPLPAYFTSPAVLQIPEGSVALVVPFARAGHGDAMLWQAASGMRFKMPEGYVYVPQHANLADPPPSATLDVLYAIQVGRAPVRSPALDAALRADLRRWQVQTVIVGPMPHRDDAVALYTSLLGSPMRDGGVDLWRLDEPVHSSP